MYVYLCFTTAVQFGENSSDKIHGPFLCVDYFALSLAMSTIVKQRRTSSPFPPLRVNRPACGSRINSNEKTDWIQIEFVRWFSQCMDIFCIKLHSRWIFKRFQLYLQPFKRKQIFTILLRGKIFLYKYRHIIIHMRVQNWEAVLVVFLLAYKNIPGTGIA